VARLLRDVDLHDATHHRRQVRALAQHPLLRVVDRLLAGQHRDEEAERVAGREERDDAVQRAHPTRHPRHVGTDAVDALLEHLRVVALLRRLVGEVPELGRAVRAGEDVLHDAADQQVLELQPHLEDVGVAPHPDLDLPLDRQVLVPGVASERVGLGEHPVPVAGVDAEVGVVPGDVDERVEVPVDGRLRQGPERRLVLGRRERRQALLGAVEILLVHEGHTASM
jgi:hypothetical protein